MSLSRVTGESDLSSIDDGFSLETTELMNNFTSWPLTEISVSIKVLLILATNLRPANHYQIDLTFGPFQPHLSGLPDSVCAHEVSGIPVRST
jgi:hypothetical protein